MTRALPSQAFLAQLGFRENERTLQNPMRNRLAHATAARGEKKKRRLGGGGGGGSAAAAAGASSSSAPPVAMRRSSRNEGKEQKNYDVDSLFKQMSREERNREQQEVGRGWASGPISLR